MKKKEYEIDDIDYLENDAVLVVDGERHFFQFDGRSATLGDALKFLFHEGKIAIRGSE